MKLITFIIFLTSLLLSCNSQIEVELKKRAQKAARNEAAPPSPPDALGEWTLVPANAGGMGLDAFYVMKYEAKAFNDANTNGRIDGGEVDPAGILINLATHIPVAVVDNPPWITINALDSTAECESLGAKYHLISNPEWMAIARDIETQDANWTGGVEGTGCLKAGNRGDFPTVGDGTNNGDTCGYDGISMEHGSVRDARAIHVLSNGQQIYDFAGNAREWVDWDPDTAGYQGLVTACTIGRVELATVVCGDIADSDFNTNNGAYGSADGVGMIKGISPAGTGIVRGGAHDGGTFASEYGAFSILATNATYTGRRGLGNPGFRCVYRP